MLQIVAPRNATAARLTAPPMGPQQQRRLHRLLSAVAPGTAADAPLPPAAAPAAAPPARHEARACVTLGYAELLAAAGAAVDASLQARIEAAYGFEGLGILAVTGVPRLAVLRRAMLPQAAEFAALPDPVKQKTETPHAFFQVGWSFGNEKLQGDRPDWAKGSYYANPLMDVPNSDPALVKQYPAFYEPNIWPSQELPGFEAAFKGLGCAIVDVGRSVFNGRILIFY